MRRLVIAIVVAAGAASAEGIEVSGGVGWSFPQHAMCGDYDCPSAPQLALRVAYSPLPWLSAACAAKA